jgi:predicted amidophosphoribosyltransferase
VVTAAASRFAGSLRKLSDGGMRGLLDLVFPPRCAFCGIDLEEAGRRVMTSGMPPTAVGGAVVTVETRLPVCEPCRRSLSAPRPRCGGCGAASGGQPPDGPAVTLTDVDPGCRHCRRFGPVCDGIVVLGGYADELRGLVLRAKRPPGEPVAAALAALLVSIHGARLAAWGIDVVVPVPMHWSRRLVRGTSSADELARGVAARLGRPRRRLLRRIRATRMQNELPVADRRGNVRGAFRCGGVFPLAGRTAAGRRLLLVDDVMTTGSTLAACREAALTAGAAAVYAAVVARADRGGDGDDH